MSLQMIGSRVIIFLCVTLCLVTGLCAAAAVDAGSEDNKTKAEKAVNELKNLAATVLKKAEIKHNEAKITKVNVEPQMNKAKRAESGAAAAAEKGNTKAKELGQKAKNELENCLTLYQDAKDKAQKAFNQTNGWLKRAQILVNSSSIVIISTPAEQNNFSEVIEKASSLKNKVQTLSEEIDGSSTLLSNAHNALLQLRESAKKIQLFKYQAESFAMVARMEVTLSEAKTGIQSIEQEKDEINNIVQEMHKVCESASGEKKNTLNPLCDKAKVELQTVSKKLKEAQECIEDMLKEKTKVDTPLETLKTTNEETEAWTQNAIVKWHKQCINEDFRNITKALQTAETSFSSATSVYKKMFKRMPQRTRQSGNGLHKEKQNGKTSDQSVDANLDKTKQNKSTQLAHEQKQNSKDDNSELLHNEKLHNITKNMTNNTIINGKMPKVSAPNDSAMTVSIPLLVALVMSAVLL